MMTKSSWINLRLRVLSALIMGPVALVAVYLGGRTYTLIVAIVMLLALLEWLQLTRNRPAWMLLAIPYIGGFGAAVFYLTQCAAFQARCWFSFW